ncbi:type II toxin-antitoxin system death-on-curing family toxin [Umezawaea tangerina]|uniref:Death-on-curing protein n=1 Tax=Umezawaea tangerina TaxID=84725 RepID=A0A2T0TB34_9PSEU|nr:type II toxin-antitoxin system death-on-curing family toxin [Umezawaea tangerina]PRY42868.1 death-on-curing protein [Umezawaea tangerina]
MIDYVQLDDLLAAARAVFGQEAEVRDWGLLESALIRPQATVFGNQAYPSFDEKAAALLHSLARNHALVDGNKRMAWVATRLFYVLNDADLRAPSVDEGEKLVVSVAAGELDVPEIAGVLATWSRGGG